VLALLDDPRTAFVLVTSPRRDAVEEAEFFAARLAESNIPVEGLIVNRVHPRFGSEVPAGLSARADELASSPNGARLAALYANLSDFRHIADRERTHVDTVVRRANAPSTVAIPFLADDVHDFTGLKAVSTHLFTDTSALV
jgi:anion-transporting  ArsA/GET3 family ATPase